MIEIVIFSPPPPDPRQDADAETFIFAGEQEDLTEGGWDDYSDLDARTVQLLWSESEAGDKQVALTELENKDIYLWLQPKAQLDAARYDVSQNFYSFFENL